VSRPAGDVRQAHPPHRAVEKIRDIAIGLLVLAAVFVVVQGGVGYLGFPRKSPWYWVIPVGAMLAVVWWYFRSSDDDDWRPPGDDESAAGGAR
jgi:hypothetical protein